MTRLTQGLLALIPAFALLYGCGGGGGQADDAGIPPRDITAEVQEYYRTKVSIPPQVREALERGEITQEEIDSRAAAGDFPKFFRQASPEDIPADLVWENGMDLPEIGSPEAKKGGTLYGWIDDFPRTLRTLGPDANGSFRPYILDDTVMYFGRRHPNDTSIGPYGFRYFPGIAKEWAVDREGRTGVRTDRPGRALVGRRADHRRRRVLHVLPVPEHLHPAALVQQLLHAQLHPRHALRRPHLRARDARDEAGHRLAAARTRAHARALLQGTRRRFRRAVPVALQAHLRALRGPRRGHQEGPSRSRSPATRTGGPRTRNSGATASTTTASTSP
jgi:hypothetical protein